MRNWRSTAALAAAIPLLAATACGGDDAATAEGDGDLSGSVQMDGSSTVGPLSEVAAELFMEENPGVQVTVAMSGTSGGFEKFCNGETDMNNASREIKEEEIDQCGENEIGYDNVHVSNDALSLVVNRENPLDCLSVDQANQIWDEGSDVATWGDVDGDIPEEIADGDLTLYGPGTDSGTFDFFTEVINGEEGQIRNDYTDIGEDDHAAVTGVAGDEYAMGYIPYSYYQEAQDEVKGLLIENEDGDCVEPTLEAVQDGSYNPLGRPLFAYASDVALEREETLAFMEYYVDNAPEIAETAGFVPLTEEQMDASREQIEALTS